MKFLKNFNEACVQLSQTNIPQGFKICSQNELIPLRGQTHKKFFELNDIKLSLKFIELPKRFLKAFVELSRISRETSKPVNSPVNATALFLNISSFI